MGFWFFLVCLSLLGYCFILTKYFNFLIETTPFFIISAMITVLYLFGYLDILRQGALLFLILGWSACLYTPIILYKDKKMLLDRYFTPGFIFGILFLIVALLTVPPLITGGDSYSFWAPFAKFISLNNGFIKVGDSVVHKSYPPGSALFSYPFMWPNFNEGNLIRAHQLLLLLPLFVLVQKISWKNWFSVVSYSIFGFVSIYILLRIGLRVPMNFWASLYMDFPVAIFFACIIIYYQLSKKKTVDILKLLPAIFALSIFKLNLLPIIFVITAVIGGDQLVIAFFELRNQPTIREFLNFFKKNRYKILARLTIILLIFITSFIAIYSWRHYLVSIQVNSEFSLPSSVFPEIIKVLQLKEITSDQVFVLAHFFLSIFRPLFLILILLVTAFLIANFQKSKKKMYEIIVENIILFLGFVAYMFGLLLLYLFIFHGYESRILASFERYAGIYYLAWILIVYNTLFHKVLKGKYYFNSLRIRWVTILFAILLLALSMYHACKDKRVEWPRRQPIISIAHEVKKYIPLSASTKILVIWQNGTGGPVTGFLRYELVPTFVDWKGSIGEPYSKRDIWYSDFSSMQFLNELSKYNYLLVAYADERFWKEYGQIFPEKPSQLKPFGSYDICLGSGFDLYMQKGCKVQQMHGYLFKVINKNGQVILKNVVR